jgi:hypothetical protein
MILYMGWIISAQSVTTITSTPMTSSTVKARQRSDVLLVIYECMIDLKIMELRRREKGLPM